MKKLILFLLTLIPAFAAQSQSWNITGNGNINPAIHFLGTTNNQPLKFRINNQYAGELDSANGKTYFGYEAGKVSTGTGNVAIGFRALYSNTTGALNTAVGYNSLALNTTASNNTAIGNRALFATTTGADNTATGYRSLYYNTTGYSNTATGTWSLYGNTTGSQNTANGYQALYSNSSGNYNTATGNQALYSNTDGTANTAYGFYALYQNNSGSNNVAVGYGAMRLNTTGLLNTSVGTLTMEYNTSGHQNTAIGHASLGNNTTGSDNTAIGRVALYGNSIGSANTAVGNQALFSNRNSNNTAIGYRTLNLTINSQFNIAAGSYAGDNYDLGWNNTFIGALTDGSFAGQKNALAVGNGTISPGDNTARFGNSATSSYGGWAGWTNVSDGRYKKNIKENVAGLDFIMKLRPVNYQMKAWDLHQQMNPNTSKEWNEYMKKAFEEKEAMIWTGFIAQEVEAAAKEAGFDFSGVDNPARADGIYGLRYAEFVVPLVKAVQEQQQIINDLQKRIAELEKKSGPLTLNNSTNALHAWPNPSNDKVIIDIVADSKSQAAIKIFDSKGALVKQQQANILPGSNQFNIDMKGLPGGTYHLSAEWSDGQVKKTAQMVKL